MVLKILIGLFVAAATFFIICTPAGASTDYERAWQREMRSEVNEWRAAHGLHRVYRQDDLQLAACYWARRLRDRRVLRHGVLGERIARYGYGVGCRYWSAGEVLARSVGTPHRVLRAWLASSAHRYIISRKRWRDVGVAARLGATPDGLPAVYWVIDFGRRY